MQPGKPLFDSQRWRAGQHASAWDRAKDAFRRDWEQTKADYSETGLELNQDAVDTLKQSVGAAPVPPLSEKTRPADVAALARDNLNKASRKAEQEVASALTRTGQERAKLDHRLSSARDGLARHQLEAAEQIAAAEQQAARGIGEAQAEAGVAVAAREAKREEWLNAEREASSEAIPRSQPPTVLDRTVHKR